MKDVIQWDAKEVNGDYPKTWNAKNIGVSFNEYEELIIEKARLKVLERIKKEKYNPRELVAKNFYTDQQVDHIPATFSVTQNLIGRVIDSFAPSPPVISQKDILNNPALMWICEVMFYA